MRVDFQFNIETWTYIHYNQFSVGSTSGEYPLTIGGFTGMGHDRFEHHTDPSNGMKFSTGDNHNDKQDSHNCAAYYNSGWWYHSCYYINFNKQLPNISGRSADIALFTEMKIRPKDCIIQ